MTATRDLREGRIDYMCINAKSANICIETNICPEGWTAWETDHKAVSMKIAGLKVIRREEKRTWQRPMYKTKNRQERQKWEE